MIKLLKSLSILFLPLSLLAEDPVIQNEEMKAEACKDSNVKLSDNLKQNNPFIPYKNAGNTAKFEANDSSTFEFLSFAEYPTHQEFSLKDINSGKSFWLSSQDEESGLDFGIKYWNFYPEDHTLIVQDIASGDLINIIQKNPVAIKDSSPQAPSLGRDSASEELLKLLADMEDLDDEEDEKGGEG